MTLNNVRSGPGHVAEYQVAALPYVTASSATAGTVSRVDFPFVTSFLTIKNASNTNDLLVGFTANGVNGSNRFTLAPSSSFAADFRIKTIFVSATAGTVNYELVAGLTMVHIRDFPVLSGSAAVTPVTGVFGYPGLG